MFLVEVERFVLILEPSDFVNQVVERPPNG